MKSDVLADYWGNAQILEGSATVLVGLAAFFGPYTLFSCVSSLHI